MPVEIPLTNGGFAVVDDQDAERVLSRQWFGYKSRETATRYAATTDTPRTSLHRFILNAAPEQYVDHRDRNGLNNCRSNLRFCTPAQNSQNRKKLRGSSRFKGVWRKKRRAHMRWVGEIRVGIKTYSITKRTQLAAARAYDELAFRYFGEFAKVNFPEAFKNASTSASPLRLTEV